jgi:hypothetical protein
MAFVLALSSAAAVRVWDSVSPIGGVSRGASDAHTAFAPGAPGAGAYPRVRVEATVSDPLARLSLARQGPGPVDGMR